MDPGQHVDVVATAAGGKRLVRRFVPTGSARMGLLVVHGIGEHSGRYQELARYAQDRGALVRAFDLSGHGASSGRRAFVRRFSDYLAEVREELTALQQEAGQVPIHVYGHSMGGLVALCYALASDTPQPSRLVLSAPALGAEAPAWQRLAAPVLGRLAPIIPIPSPVQLDQLSHDPAVGEAYAKDPLVTRSVTARLGHETLRAMEHARRSLTGLKQPTLVIHGGDDTLVPTRTTEILATVPTVTRTVYPGMRHELHHERDRERVLEDVLAFLTDSLP